MASYKLLPNLVGFVTLCICILLYFFLYFAMYFSESMILALSHTPACQSSNATEELWRQETKVTLKWCISSIQKVPHSQQWFCLDKNFPNVIYTNFVYIRNIRNRWSWLISASEQGASHPFYPTPHKVEEERIFYGN